MKLTGFLAHTVLVCAQGGNPELLINRITCLGITPKEIMPIKTGIVFSIPARRFKMLKSIRKGTGCKIFLVRKAGPLFLFKRLYRRPSLIFAVILFFVSLHLLSGVVWRIDTTGLTEQNSTAVKSLLFAQGIYPGCFADSDHFRMAEQNILIDSETFSYLKLNFSDGRLEVGAHLTNPYTSIESDSSQLFAAFDGIIHFIEVYEGYSLVKVNQSVAEGQILVDNIKLTIDDEIVPSNVLANIIAYGEAEYTHFEPIKFTANLLTANTSAHYAIHLLGMRIPLYAEKKLNSDYHRQTTIQPLNIFGLKFPVTIEKTYLTATQKQEVTLSNEEAVFKAEQHIEWQFTEEYMFPTVLSKDIDVTTDDDGNIIAKVKYTFLANIIKNS